MSGYSFVHSPWGTKSCLTIPRPSTAPRRELRGDRRRGRPGGHRPPANGLRRAGRRGHPVGSGLLPRAVGGDRDGRRARRRSDRRGQRIPPGSRRGGSGDQRTHPRDRRRRSAEPLRTLQSGGELAALARLADEHDLLLIHDVTHAPLVIDADVPFRSLPALKLTDNAVATFSVSHCFGMAGARIGFLAGPARLMHGCLRLKAALTRLNTSLIAQHGPSPRSTTMTTCPTPSGSCAPTSPTCRPRSPAWRGSSRPHDPCAGCPARWTPAARGSLRRS